MTSAQTALDTATEQIAAIPTSEDPKTAFETARATVKTAVSAVKMRIKR